MLGPCQLITVTPIFVNYFCINLGRSQISFEILYFRCLYISQIGQLLLECLVLLGYFALFHPENQAVLRWGKSPTILHKVSEFVMKFHTCMYVCSPKL